MPTVLLLDVSLSMFRPVSTPDPTETHTRFSLAATAINSILDYLNVHAKLEYVSLVTFSSVYDVAVSFTRDFDVIRNKLPQLEEGDKTCLNAALLGVNQIVLSEWGSQTPVQIILITDGSCGVGPSGRSRIIQGLPLPPPYPAKVHVLPIAAPQETSLQHSIPLYQKVVDLASAMPNASITVTRGLIYCPDQLSVPGVTAASTRLCEQQYQEAWCTLRCGQLECRVQLFPPPLPPADAPAPLARTAHVIGFISQQDLGTPISVSKHLLIPQPQTPNSSKDNFDPKTPTKESAADGSATEDDMSDPSKIPNFCVLLHGAMKVAGMSALVSVGGGGGEGVWCGVVGLCGEAARGRRSSLLLTLLRPGARAAPWLGPLDQLGDAADVPRETFPIRVTRSYSSGGGGGGGAGGGGHAGCAWARPHALLADVQKLLRHARKLPEKTQHLYKELNRLRRAAISLGFSELLTCVSGALERECATLPPGASQECSLQLAHAANALRDPRTALDIKHTLQPLGANFSLPH